MASITGRITWDSAQVMQSLGFRAANLRAWIHNSSNDRQILLGERSLYLSAPVINHEVPFHLQERDLPLSDLHLILEILAEDSFHGLDVGYVRLPFDDIVHPGSVIAVSRPIQSSDQRSAIGVLNVAVYTELPVNYPHPSPAPQALYPYLGRPSPAPQAPYPYLGYMPVAPQAHFQPRPIFVNAVSHFLGGIVGEIGNQVMNQASVGLGGIVGEIGNQVMNQDSFGDGLISLADWLPFFFNM